MSLRDFILFLLVSLLFAAGNVLARYMIADMDIPPLFYAAMRYLVVTVVLCHLLWPMPKPRGALVAGTLLLGVCAFGLFYIALEYVDASSAAVVNLAQSPIGVLLAIGLLGERPSPRRLAGTVVTLAGVGAVIYRPGGFEATTGLWIVLGSAFCAALGSIVCRKLQYVPPMRFQAWSGLLCFAVLGPATLILEDGQWQAAAAAGWRFVGAVLFMGLVVSVVALTMFVRFLQRYDANLMAALSLLMPLFTVVLGVVVLGEPLGLRMVLGVGVACAGVLVVSFQKRPGITPLARPSRPAVSSD